MYTQKCLLMFYNSFAKSVISYGLLIYGSATESILKKNLKIFFERSNSRKKISIEFLKTRIVQDGKIYLFATAYSRPIIQRKLLSNFLMKCSTWLTKASLLPCNLKGLSRFQIKGLMSKVTIVFNAENKHLFSLNFEKFET